MNVNKKRKRSKKTKSRPVDPTDNTDTSESEDGFVTPIEGRSPARKLTPIRPNFKADVAPLKAWLKPNEDTTMREGTGFTRYERR